MPSGQYRQQFGIRSFCVIFLALHVIFILGHLFVRDLASAVAVRAASGVAGSALTALGVFYMIQALPMAHRQRAVVLGIGMPQLALPLARLFPIDFLALDNWRGLYLFELGLSLLTLAAVFCVRLPPNKRVAAFEKLDLVTFFFYACAIAFFGSAVGLGSYLWWTNRAWIGWFLAAALPCLMIALCIEYFRARPLINVRWLGNVVLIRFALVSLVARIVLSEPSIGAIGLLRDFGLANDDIRPLSLLILVAAVAGLTTSAIAVSPTRVTPLVMLAVALVAVASFADSYASMSTRLPQLYYTQMMIAFATTVFIGPSFVFGMSKVIAGGGANMTSFVALFGITQSIGTLVGTSIIQTYLTYSQQYHLTSFAGQVGKSNPLVSDTTRALAQDYASVIQDPTLRAAEGLSQFGQHILLNARVAAYDDVFFLVSALAGITTIFLMGVILHGWRANRRVQRSTQ
ncbi:hypothetical protein N8E89_18695 (plasmid) [Phyllobacterium sp. A18/5-2]|uniref:hypothetical protein n=1 Tax=Phyllobacterium sp. A18/5-2 TaxID=2978392 RepID=UPI0021C72C3C|nr:hypothetical protein [Phyllobacterium sp. A18/5-2]UXN66657.1 hypothetical protein N8E89_18695 [Phyllobacterium sp. A18/5-2]